MQIDNFQLKAISKNLKLNEEIILLDSYTPPRTKDATCHRIKTQYKKIPIYFTITTTKGQKETSVKEIEFKINSRISKIKELMREPFNKEHVVYIKENAWVIIGRKYEILENRYPSAVNAIVSREVDRIYKESTNDFKEIYLKFIKEVNIEKIIEGVEKEQRRRKITTYA